MLAYALIYGEFGLPRLEMFGAGLATTIVNLGMCVAGVWVCYACRPFKKYRVLGRFWVPDWPLFGRLFAIGAPISGTMLLEYGVFAAAALLMGWLGTAALAAHQIAITIASIMFMVPFGISMAATVRVGHAVGRRDAEATRRAGMAAIALGAGFMAADDAARGAVPAMSSRWCSWASAHAADRTRRCSLPRRCCWSARASSSPTACRRSRPARCAG